MVKLTDNNFNLKNKQLKTINNKLSIVFIYADWCIHCQHFKPIFNKTKSLTKNMNFYTSDSQDIQNTGIMKTFKVSSFPCILLFNKDGIFISEYKGPRDTVISFKKNLKNIIT